MSVDSLDVEVLAVSEGLAVRREAGFLGTAANQVLVVKTSSENVEMDETPAVRLLDAEEGDIRIELPSLARK
jgi:D-serine dehydratase